MYRVTDQQEKEIQGWVDKLPDSIVKSQIINLFEEVYPTNRMTVEQLEKLLSFQNALPKEFQSYPQIVAQWFKNAPATEKREAAEGTPKKEQANFQKMVADSHAHVKTIKPDGDTGEQKQEILHTLNVTDPTLAGTKADPLWNADDDKGELSYEENIIEEAAAVKKTGKKSQSQQVDEDSILARNKDADIIGGKNKAEKQKVVVVNKKAAQKPVSKKAVVKSAPKSLKGKPTNKRK